jgi:hypothetical protein
MQPRVLRRRLFALPGVAERAQALGAEMFVPRDASDVRSGRSLGFGWLQPPLHQSFEGFGAGVESCQKTLPPVVLCHSHNAATGVKSLTLQRPQARPASILTQGRQDYKRRAQLPFSSPAPALVGSVSCFAVSSRARPSAAYKHLVYRPRRLMRSSTMTTRTTMMRMGIPTVTVTASIVFSSLQRRALSQESTAFRQSNR